MNNNKVYIYTNIINKKVYIGQTNRYLSQRAGKNGLYYQTSPHFYAAILKYGWDNFKSQILKDNLSNEEADYWERYYIKKYDSKNPEKGYNILDGGKGLSEETKQERSQKFKEKWQNGEFDYKIIDSVYCVELNKQYSSAHAAGLELQLDDGCIIKTCKGIQKYCGVINGSPLHWLFSKDITENKINELKNRQEVGVPMPIYCIELNQIFNSIFEASKQLHIDRSTLGHVLRGTRGHSAGKHPITKEKLHWIFVNSEEFKNKYKDISGYKETLV